ncbi:MAG: terpene cyclase/mutase family protein [Planctomycetes bacterium]|nr:terpene cyclase/mutase family protein [Planctomycetota bacterium]
MKTGIGARSERERLRAEAELKSTVFWLTRSPWWAMAAALHLLLAVVLMNIVHLVRRPAGSAMFRVAFRPPAGLVPDSGARQGDQDRGVNGHDNEEAAPAGPENPADRDPRGAVPLLPPTVPIAPGLAGAGGLRAPGLGLSGQNGLGGLYAGRGGAGRGEALLKNGGDESTEKAVNLGLDWLARHQAADGSWGATPASPCTVCSEVPAGNPVACTGLALLAFAGAGYTHFDETDTAWTECVRRGVKYLVKRQRKDGLIDEPGDWHRGMYSHGIASFALAEIFAMTQDPLLRSVVTAAVRASGESQQTTGGWDYGGNPTGRSDSSITSWHVQALRSARLGSIPVEKTSWDLAIRFYEAALDRSKPSIRYDVYPQSAGGNGTLAVSAGGLLARHYLGVKDEPELNRRLAERILLEKPVYCIQPGNDSIGGKEGSHYYTYYATLFMLTLGGEAWPKWNRLMKAALIAAQEGQGCRAGSWPVGETDARMAGRVYSTALAVLDLEVYYRYLPTTAEDGDLVSLVERPGMTREQLLRALEDDDAEERFRAARTLMRKLDREAAGAVVAAAKRDAEGRGPIMISWLGGLPEDDALVEMLAGLIEHPVEEFRRAACDALQRTTGAHLTTPAQWSSWMLNRKNRRAAQAGGK